MTQEKRQSLKELYIKFIFAFCLFLSVPTVVLYFFVFKPIFQKNRAQTEANIEKLSSYLDQTNVNLIERKDCKEGILGFFHYKNIQQSEIVMCINNFDSKDRNLYWKTLVHESVHVAQACNGGLLSNEEEFKYKVGQLTGFSMDDYMTVHNSYSSNSYEWEVEAFFYENRYHQEIFKVYEDFCLAKKRIN
tara:strand:- start:861 stop:1430 length:570 start_codon:yes stop_codon:yes gene_type:complete